MKLFLILVFLLTILEAKSSKIVITSDSFKADDSKKITTFKGNVTVTKGEDKINSDIMTIKFDKNNKPISYVAKQNVKFKIHLKQSYYDGNCEYLQYNPKTKIYTLKEKVHITEYPENRVISAGKVIIDAINEKTEILGSKNKPIKFIFDIKE